MRAYDATLHYTGKTPYYFLYPDGYFLPFPPGLENAPPQSKEFVQFVKRMAKEFSLNSRELALNPISELLDMRVVNLAGDGGEEISALFDFQTSFALSAAAAAAVPTPPPSSSEAYLSKENSDHLMSDAEVIYLSSSSESDLTSDKGVEEEAEVFSTSPLSGDGGEEISALFDVQTSFELSAAAAAAVPTPPSSSEAYFSKENSYHLMLDAEVIYLSSSSESDQLTSDKGVEEEAEVVSNPLPALFPVPEVALQYDYPDQTVAATVTGATSFQMDSPTGEDLANLLFNADGVVGLDKNLLFGDSDLWRDQLSDLVPALFCPDNDDVVEPASKKRILRVASFKVDTARDASGMMPGADNTKKSCLHPCLVPVFRES
jgi:acyl-CoA synthetase (AMP-forming)/AMP-acid ligase II